MQLEEFDEVAAGFTELVAGTPIGALERPTPCTEWTVRLLINHVVTGTQWFTSVIEGTEVPDRTIDQVQDDPSGAFARRLDAFRAAIGQPGALERSYHHAMGDMAGPVYLQMRANEYMVHGWDLAQATGQMPRFPDEAALSCLEMYRAMLAGREREVGKGFGIELPTAPDAAPLDRLVAFFGRTP